MASPYQDWLSKYETLLRVSDRETLHAEVADPRDVLLAVLELGDSGKAAAAGLLLEAAVAGWTKSTALVPLDELVRFGLIALRDDDAEGVKSTERALETLLAARQDLKPKVGSPTQTTGRLFAELCRLPKEQARGRSILAKALLGGRLPTAKAEIEALDKEKPGTTEVFWPALRKAAPNVAQVLGEKKGPRSPPAKAPAPILSRAATEPANDFRPWAILVVVGTGVGALWWAASKIPDPKKAMAGIEDEAPARVEPAAVAPTSHAMVASNKPPRISDSTTEIHFDHAQIALALSYDDPDGPGPYVVQVLKPPTHGEVIEQDGQYFVRMNDGFTGSDSLEWAVSDGLHDSNRAKVTLLRK